MVYKFLIGSDEAENFKLEISIDSEDTFLRLRNAILDAAGYSREQIDSFYICDEDWNKVEEVTYLDMGIDDTDVDIYIMEDTHLDELLEEEGQRLKFVFDYMTERHFFMRLKETIPGKNLLDPLCNRKVGKAPRETLESEKVDPIVTKVVSLDDDVEELGEEFYGDQSFDEEELAGLDAFEGDEL